MRRVAVIRQYVQTIPGAFFEIDPQEARRGIQAGIKTLWNPTGEQKLAPGELEQIAGAPDDSEEKSTSAQIEELFEIGAEVDEDLLMAAMNGSDGERIRQAVLVNGVDALGWYVSFHARGAQWGIYVPMSGIAYLMKHGFSDLSADPITKLRIAFRAIHQHELFHFAADYTAAQWESILGKPCFVPARRLRDDQFGYNLLEEECANAHMMRSFLGGRSSLKAAGRMDAIRSFVRMQPPGYKNGDHKQVAYFQRAGAKTSLGPTLDAFQDLSSPCRTRSIFSVPIRRCFRI